MYRLKKPQIIARLVILTSVAAFFALSSCSSTKPLVPAVVDSTSTFSKTVERDTNITAPGASTSLFISWDKLIAAQKLDYGNTHPAPGYGQPGISPQSQPATRIPIGTSQNKQASATASIQNGQLQIDCKCDSVSIAAKLLDKYKQTEHTRTVTLPPKEIKYVPWYTTALAWLGGVSLVAILILAYIGIKRKFSV